MKAPIERLMARVEKTPDCWVWAGSVGSHGYGQLYIKRPDGRQGMALTHRLSYETFVGPIPAGLQIDHLCRNRRCVRPEHLEAVTQRVNILRSESPSALSAVATHCIRGHEFGAETTRLNSKGHRECIPCDRIRNKARVLTEEQKEAARVRSRAWHRANKARKAAA